MVGTPVVARVLANIALVVLLVRGLIGGELRARWAAVFVVLWAVGYVGLPRLSPFSGSLVTSHVAAIDIVLVLIIFRSDVRLT
jgi:hypothetical protein